MERLTISLSPEQRKYLQAAVASGNYASESEVLRDMIRQRQRAEAKESLTNALLHGFEGESVDLTDTEMKDIWDEARRNVQARQQAK